MLSRHLPFYDYLLNPAENRNEIAGVGFALSANFTPLGSHSWPSRRGFEFTRRELGIFRNCTEPSFGKFPKDRDSVSSRLPSWFPGSRPYVVTHDPGSMRRNEGKACLHAMRPSFSSWKSRGTVATKGTERGRKVSRVQKYKCPDFRNSNLTLCRRETAIGLWER